MKKSLFRRLLSTYILVISLGIGIVSILFYIFFSSYYFKLEEKQLRLQADEMASVVRPYLQMKEYSQVRETVGIFNKVSIPNLWVVDKKGEIIGGPVGEKNLESECPEEDELQKALDGKLSVSRGNTGHDKEPVLSIVLPVYGQDELIGAIFICHSLSEIRGSILNALKTVVVAGLLAVIIVILVSFFISRNITRPVTEITEASLEMAEGNFNRKVKIHCFDEIGKLGDTFNYMSSALQKSLKDLADERDRMCEMEKIQREFVANASHEIRTPLTSIRGYLEAILDGVIDNREQELKVIRTIHKETQRLYRLANNLLDLAGYKGSNIKVTGKEVSINEIIARVVSKLTPLAEDHQIDLDCECLSTVSTVLGDEDFIERILTNYITNAVRFTPEGGWIKVRSELAGEEVHIHVADSGIGIPQKDLPKVWERFYKVNETRHMSKEGAGLGLALVKEMVERLGGKVWAESAQGRGSVFSFSLGIN